MTWDFSNARISHSAIGPKARTYNGAAADPQQVELLRRLDDLRGAVADAAGTHPAGLPAMIDDLEDAVASGQEPPAALASRWERIWSVLDPTLQASANVAQIAGVIAQLLHG